MMSSATNAGAVHAKTARLGLREIVRRLNAALGATLVAGLAGSKNRKNSYKWAQQDGPTPHASAVKRLQFAYTQWALISEAEDEHVARLWFIGANPWLDHDSPVDAIREDRFREVAAAAAAMVDDRFIG